MCDIEFPVVGSIDEDVFIALLMWSKGYLSKLGLLKPCTSQEFSILAIYLKDGFQISK